MTYLIATFALLFLLATVLGFLLGHWWARRSFVDVTESYSSLTQRQRTDDERWQALNGGLTTLVTSVDNFSVPQPDLGSIHDAISTVQKSVSGIKIPQTDLSPVHTGIAGVSKLVSEFRVPQTDLGPITSKLDALRSQVDALPVPEKTDVTPLQHAIGAVADSVAAIRIPAAANLDPLSAALRDVDKKVAAIRMPEPTNLVPLTAAISSVDKKIDSIRIPEPSNLAPLTAAISNVDKKIDNIRIPQPSDLSPIAAQLTRVEGRIGQIPKPATVDLSPLNTGLTTLRNDVRGINTDVDLAPLSRRLDALDKTVAKLPVVNTHPPTDLGPVRTEIDRLRAQIASIKPADFSNVQMRLDRIEALLKQRPAAQKPVAPKPAPKPKAGPALFKSAVHGKKDDLKKISGVGPKLEGLLNKHGVYYFWQVASWNRTDITFIDDRLDVFKGRIERDEWVRQAKTLQRSPGAAQAPTDG